MQSTILDVIHAIASGERGAVGTRRPGGEARACSWQASCWTRTWCATSWRSRWQQGGTSSTSTPAISSPNAGPAQTRNHNPSRNTPLGPSCPTLPLLPTKGPMWGYPRPVLGAVDPLLEPFLGHLSPNIDNVSEKMTLRYPHEGPWVVAWRGDFRVFFENQIFPSRCTAAGLNHFSSTPLDAGPPPPHAVQPAFTARCGFI